MVVSRLSLPADRPLGELSGGWRRRTLLGKALVSEPDLLLLDEPTNHLDIDAIRWLEDALREFQGALLFVTHDRAFLSALATRILDLDRGTLTSWPGTYASYLEKKAAAEDAEARALERMDRKLEKEEAWLRQGVKARRTRNEGRVRALVALRAERAALRSAGGEVRFSIDAAERSGRLVFEAENVSKSYGGVPIVQGYTQRIVRGDRIGLIGPNGAGKTTLLKLLAGEIEPDAGTIRRGARVQIAYFDQQREQLDPERSVADSINDGNDTVVVNGQPRHVVGYLADFLFPRERAVSPVKSLSGGERNRLMLARLFARPANVLVMDEPTNDLDIETLELVEELVADFPGHGAPRQPRSDVSRQHRDEHAGVRGARADPGIRGRMERLSAAVIHEDGDTRRRRRAEASCGAVAGQRRDAGRAKEALVQGAAGVRRAARADRGARNRAAASAARVRVRGVLQGARGAHRGSARADRSDLARARGTAGALAGVRRSGPRSATSSRKNS